MSELAMNNVFDGILGVARAVEIGEKGFENAENLKLFLDETVTDYAAKMHLDPVAVAKAILTRGAQISLDAYSDFFFPQSSKFVSPKCIESIFAMAKPNGYICPMCRSIVHHPSICMSGKLITVEMIFDCYRINRNSAQNTRQDAWNLVAQVFGETPLICKANMVDFSIPSWHGLSYTDPAIFADFGKIDRIFMPVIFDGMDYEQIQTMIDEWEQQHAEELGDLES